MCHVIKPSLSHIRLVTKNWKCYVLLEQVFEKYIYLANYPPPTNSFSNNSNRCPHNILIQINMLPDKWILNDQYTCQANYHSTTCRGKLELLC